MLNSLKVRTRLLLLSVSMIIAIIGVSVLGVIGVNNITNLFELSYRNNLVPLSRISQVESNIIRQNLLLQDAYNATNANSREGYIEELLGRREQNDGLIIDYTAGIVLDEERALYQTFSASLDQYRSALDAAIAALRSNDLQESELLTAVNSARALGREVQDNVSAIVDFNESVAETRFDEGTDMANGIFVNIITVAVIITIIAIIFTLLIITSITKPFNILISKISQMAGSDLAIEVPTGYRAEFGDMFEEFKKMAYNLNGLIQGAKGISGDVRGSFTDVKGEIGEMNSSITEMDSFLNVLATDMDNQVAGLKESAVAMDNIASGIQQIAESSTSVAELATETSTQANDGSAVIEKSVAQMETINQVVVDTSDVVDRLVKRTKTIDEALKAIKAIADQTNLLALNASIEAARAGEHGRGFAVVAEEVSKLADQSKESADEINILLQEINEDTNEAVQAMEQGKIESKQGIEVIQQAGLAFSSIVEQVSTMTEQIQEVSSTVEEMSAGTEEVNSSLSDIVSGSESISTQTTEAVQKTKEQVEVANKIVNVMDGANEEVEHLEEELNKFKTEKTKDTEEE